MENKMTAKDTGNNHRLAGTRNTLKGYIGPDGAIMILLVVLAAAAAACFMARKKSVS